MKTITTDSPRQEASLLSWIFFGSLFFVSWLSGIDESAPWLPFFLSIFLIGLPHGAADWLLLRPRSRASGFRYFLLYSLAGAVIVVLAALFPTVVIISFLLLTIIHFGLADERDLRAFAGPSRPLPPFPFGGIARIGVFLGLICWLDPVPVAALFGRVERLLGGSDDDGLLLEWISLGAPIGLSLSLVAWILSMFASVGPEQRARDGGAVRRLVVELSEGTLLVAAAFLLEPVFAVGLYFLCWHAWRHSFLIADRVDGESSRWKKFGLLHVRSWPLYLPVLPAMAWLVFAFGEAGSPADWVAALLVVCIVFTLPHHLIVERKLVGSEADSRRQSGSAGSSNPVAGGPSADFSVTTR